MGALDNLMGKHVIVNDVPLPDRKTVRFAGAVTASDSPSENTTDIVVTGGGGAIADGSVTLAKLGDGTDVNQQMIWNGTDWVLQNQYDTFVELPAEGVVIGRKVYLAGHTVHGYGGGDFIGVSGVGLVTNGGNVKANAAGTLAWRRVEQKFYPENFGARGDGTTDDTAAIMAAITAAGTKSVIEFTGNRTYLHGAINLTGKNELLFQGNGATLSYSVADGARVFDLADSVRITFQDLTIARTAGTPLYVFDARGIGAGVCFVPTWINCKVTAPVATTALVRFAGCVTARVTLGSWTGGQAAFLGDAPFNIDIVFDQTNTSGQGVAGYRNPGTRWSWRSTIANHRSDNFPGFIFQDVAAPVSGSAWSLEGCWCGDSAPGSNPYIELHAGVLGLSMHGCFAYCYANNFLESEGPSSGWDIQGNHIFDAPVPFSVSSLSGSVIKNNFVGGIPVAVVCGTGCVSNDFGTFNVANTQTDTVFLPINDGDNGQEYPAGIRIMGIVDGLPPIGRCATIGRAVAGGNNPAGAIFINPSSSADQHAVASVDLNVVMTAGTDAVPGLSVRWDQALLKPEVPFIATRIRQAVARVVGSGDASLTLADNGAIIDLTAAVDQMVTIPLAATVNFPLGTLIKIHALHATARKRWRPVAGVTLRIPTGFGSLARPWGESWIRKIGANEWALGGEILFDIFTMPGAKVSYCADWGVTVATGVSAMLDISPEANDLAQVTPGNQPALVSAWRNGRNAIQGASGKLLISGVMSYAAPSTVIAVGEWESSVATTYTFAHWTTAPELGLFNQLGNPSIAAGTLLGTGGTIANATPFVWFNRVNGATSSVRIEPHGAAVQTGAGAAGAAGMAGQLRFLNHSSVLPFLGKGSVLIGYDRLLTLAEETQALAQLRSEYNIYSTGL